MIDWPDVSRIDGVSPHQRAALAAATVGNLGLFSGGPGCGKTHCIARLIRSIPGNRYSVGLCAPTGKAAVRMTEFLSEQGLNASARTIHSMLQPMRGGHDGEGWSFMFNEWNKLPYDILIVDESSMIPTSLMKSLLAACEAGTKILFVGDPFQLPPVGHGKPFADMIDAGLPHGHLTEIWRFAGRIANVCQDIKHGQRWIPSAEVNLDAEKPENMKHIERASPAAQIDALKTVISRMADRGFDPVQDVQVLVAVNEKSAIGRKPLNRILQEMLNSHGQRVEKNPFRVGDKAICLKNQWIEADWTEKRKPDGLPQHYIANGEIGIVLRVGPAWASVKFGEGKTVRVNKSVWSEFDLAYAITGHKSQGSQWPVVIVMADDYGGANFITGRSWWYTCLSRASKLCITIGRRSTIDRHCTNIDIVKRKTFLQEKIHEWTRQQKDELRLALSSL